MHRRPDPLPRRTLLTDLLPNIDFFAPALSALAVSWLSYQWYSFRATRSKIDFIPTIGGSGFITSYLTAWKYLIFGHQLIEDGYKKFEGNAFKVATFETSTRWMVVVSGPDVVDDLRRAGDEQLSSIDHMIDLLQVNHTFSKEVIEAGWYHIPVFQKQLTRNINALLPDVVDEMQNAFQHCLPPSEGRSPEFLSLQTGYATRVVLAATAIGLFPAPLRPLAGRVLSRVPSATKKLKGMMGPMLQDRLDKHAKLGGDWEGKPNDLVSWLLEAAPEDRRNVDDLIYRILFANFAALLTTTITISDTLFNLAVRTEYLAPLRTEVEEAIGDHGWTKEALGDMHKLDSFIKECARLGGVNSGLVRKAVKDFTFSNGLTIPAGYTVGCVTRAAQFDSSLFDNSDTFDGYRFINTPEDWVKVSLVSQDSKFLLFGGGRHICPGRFFAVTELKLMLAHILINYDMRLPDGAVTVPEGQWFGTNRSANAFAKIQFRKRSLI